MRNLGEQLGTYALYHRDRRNIATHFAGVPMILFATVSLLSRPPLLALAASLGAAVFYFRLDLRFGAAMTSLLLLALASGARLAALPTATWLIVSIGLFAIGWVIQFVGHAFEGKKPAFVDDLVGLLVGPLFVVAEWSFMLGLRLEVRDAIEAKAGPTRAGKPAPAT